ncbi:MAG: hypothetical protein JNL05_00655 [Flavobacteriales bacterium]|nr:hypothetical protein [Flavobacteriales bacterium]
MLRIALALVLLLHGLIHLMGTAKAFGWAAVQALPRAIGRPTGVAWGVAALFFVLAGWRVFRHDDRWWITGAMAVLLSQVLIVAYGREARWGTAANVVLLVAIAFGFGVWQFRGAYERAVSALQEQARTLPERPITEADLGTLPPPIQAYLRGAGVVGTLRPRSMRLTFHGTIRSKDGPWMPFTSVQVNRFDEPERLFWMDATMKGLPTKGYHRYAQGKARMHIKLLGLVPVFDIEGPALDTSETVTWFNDLCLFAPGALLDQRITFVQLDDHRVRATFAHDGMVISAELVFDAQHRLIDFISEDRSYLRPDKAFERRRFSTPCSMHRVVNGVRVPGLGETVFVLDDGPLTYGRFELVDLRY